MHEEKNWVEEEIPPFYFNFWATLNPRIVQWFWISSPKSGESSEENAILHSQFFYYTPIFILLKKTWILHTLSSIYPMITVFTPWNRIQYAFFFFMYDMNPFLLFTIQFYFLIDHEIFFQVTSTWKKLLPNLELRRKECKYYVFYYLNVLNFLKPMIKMWFCFLKFDVRLKFICSKF